MAKPEFKVNGGVYLFTWPEYQIGVKLDRFKEDSKHNVVCEITIQNTAPGVSPHIHQARLNLTSTTSRNSLTRHLHDRMNSVEWAGIVEQFSVMTLRHFREGEPVIKAKAIVAEESIAYRMKPLLVEGQANLIHGTGGVGKSMLGVLIGSLVSLPASLFEGSDTDWFRGEAGNVLYLDYETSEQEFKKRTELVQQGLGYGVDSEIFYRFCIQPLATEVEVIQKIIIENDISLAIIDSMGQACGGEPEKAEPVLTYFRALRSLRITTLTIDHHNKEGGLYGNIYKWNHARNIWEIRKVQEPGDNHIYMGLFHKKSNNSKLHRPIGFDLRFDDDRATFNTTKVADIPEFEEGMSMSERLKAALSKGALGMDDIYEYLGITKDKAKDAVRQALSRGTRNGYFAKINDKYGLSQKTGSVR